MENLEFLEGCITVSYIILTILMGSLICARYFKYRKNELLFVGVAWMGMAFAWLPDVIDFCLDIGNVHIPSDNLFVLYFILNIALIPIFVSLWLIAFTELLNVQKSLRIVIISLYIGISLILIIYLTIFLNINREVIGTMYYTGGVRWSELVENFLVVNIVIILITGLLFASKSFRADDKQVKLKGKLLLIAFITFALGAVLDALFLYIIIVLIARTILLMGSILFYIGFVLPNWLKKILIKEE